MPLDAEHIIMTLIAIAVLLALFIRAIVLMIRHSDLRLLSDAAFYLFATLLFLAWDKPVLEGILAFMTLVMLIVTILVHRHKD